jgi:hypothetical protein
LHRSRRHHNRRPVVVAASARSRPCLDVGRGTNHTKEIKRQFVPSELDESMHTACMFDDSVSLIQHALNVRREIHRDSRWLEITEPLP